MADTRPDYRVSGKRVYRGFSQQELNAQYDARGTAPDGDKYRDFISKNSARVRGERDCRVLGGASRFALVHVHAASFLDELGDQLATRIGIEDIDGRFPADGDELVRGV